MITCQKEEEGELCTTLLDIIRTEKEEEEEEVQIPASAKTVTRIFLTEMKLINSVKTAGAASEAVLEAVEAAEKQEIKGEEHFNGEARTFQNVYQQIQ